jgi:hypothetical protein
VFSIVVVPRHPVVIQESEEPIAVFFEPLSIANRDLGLVFPL